MTANSLKQIVGGGILPEETEGLAAWLRMEVSKLVAEADCKPLIYTTFDENLVASTKNAIIRHIFNKWEL